MSSIATTFLRKVVITVAITVIIKIVANRSHHLLWKFQYQYFIGIGQANKKISIIGIYWYLPTWKKKLTGWPTGNADLFWILLLPVTVNITFIFVQFINCGYGKFLKEKIYFMAGPVKSVLCFGLQIVTYPKAVVNQTEARFGIIRYSIQFGSVLF